MRVVRLRAWFGRRSPSIRRLILFGLVVLILSCLLWFVPTPYYITAPGAAVDTGRIVRVENGTAHPGSIYMLLVTTQPANLFWYLYAQLDSRAELETPERFLGGLEDYPQCVEYSRELMRDSQKTAMAVAMQQLGYGHGVTAAAVRVTHVRADSPVAGLLRADDLFLEVRGRPVRSTKDLTDQLLTIPAGEILSVLIRRAGAELRLELPTTESTLPERKGRAAFGILVADHLEYDIPIPVSIGAGAITGPSAGLSFTLQIIDQLVPGGITGGQRVAATGTIEPDGRVGRIGGVRQKVHAAAAAGAKVMFVPAEDYPEASQVRTYITVVPVAHVRDALDWLRIYSFIDKAPLGSL